MPYVCSVTDHRWHQNVVRTSSVIYYCTDSWQHGIYLFYIITKQTSTDKTFLFEIFQRKPPFAHFGEHENNWVLSTGLIMWISHRKEIRKLTFQALALRRSESRANARNVSFGISLRWLIHIINPVDKTQLSRYNSHRRSTTVSLETYPSKHENSHLAQSINYTK